MTSFYCVLCIWNSLVDQRQDFFRWVSLPAKTLLVIGLLWSHHFSPTQQYLYTWHVLLINWFILFFCFLLLLFAFFFSFYHFIKGAATMHVLSTYYFGLFLLHDIAFSVLLLLPFSCSACCCVIYCCCFCLYFTGGTEIKNTDTNDDTPDLQESDGGAYL